MILTILSVHRRYDSRIHRARRASRLAAAHVKERGREHDDGAEEDGCHDHGGQTGTRSSCRVWCCLTRGRRGRNADE